MYSQDTQTGLNQGKAPQCLQVLLSKYSLAHYKTILVMSSNQVKHYLQNKMTSGKIKLAWAFS